MCRTEGFASRIKTIRCMDLRVTHHEEIGDEIALSLLIVVALKDERGVGRENHSLIGLGCLLRNFL
jgi:hypothetical protein